MTKEERGRTPQFSLTIPQDVEDRLWVMIEKFQADSVPLEWIHSITLSIEDGEQNITCEYGPTKHPFLYLDSLRAKKPVSGLVYVLAVGGMIGMVFSPDL